MNLSHRQGPFIYSVNKGVQEKNDWDDWSKGRSEAGTTAGRDDCSKGRLMRRRTQNGRPFRVHDNIVKIEFAVINIISQSTSVLLFEQNCKYQYLQSVLLYTPNCL